MQQLRLQQVRINGRGRHGLNIYYYGSGKGKTTAAVGLAVRAAGAGMNVCILQFVKAGKPPLGIKRQPGEWPVSSEINYFEDNKKRAGSKSKKAGSKKTGTRIGTAKIGRIDTKQVGAGFVGILGDSKQKSEHINAAAKGMELAEQIIKSDKYDLVILDELISALELDLIAESEALRLINSKPAHIHLAYTGHNRYPKIENVSDLVSEVKMIKHPYYSGKLAQKGIDF